MKKKNNISTPVVSDPSQILRALVGLKDIRILFYRRNGPIAEIAIEQVLNEPCCPSCDMRAYIKDRPWVSYTDLSFGGTATRLLWRKHRMCCSNPSCATKSWTARDHRIAAKGCRLTTRAAKWATKAVGMGRTVSEVAGELGCDWGVVNKAVMIYGAALLAADRKRLGITTAIGLDETLFSRKGRYKTKKWCTTVADVGNSQLIDLLPSRDYVDVAAWIRDQSQGFREKISYGALDMSATYAAVYSVMLPKAVQVVDRFHLMRLSNYALDQIRRRVQQREVGHRGRKGDPLYRSRKLLVMRESRLDRDTSERLATLLSLGDPHGEVALAYRVKEAVAEFYETYSPTEAQAKLTFIVDHLSNPSVSPELRTLGRTIKRWFTKILAYHLQRITNGPTEGLNNLIKRVKRVGFGFANFGNYRIRVLLYAGKPNWRVLDSIVVL